APTLYAYTTLFRSERSRHGQWRAVQLGDAADEPAQRRRDRPHPHLRDEQLGQRRRNGDRRGSAQGARRDEGSPSVRSRTLIRRLLLATVFAAAAAAAEPAKVDGGELATVLPRMPGTEAMRVEDFLLAR